MSRRLVALVFVLLLLASATSAFAECAWVLWREQEFRLPPVAFVDRAGCTTWIDDQVKECESRTNPDPKVVRNPGGTAAEFRVTTRTSGVPALRYHCLPDTIDSRAPKAQ